MTTVAALTHALSKADADCTFTADGVRAEASVAKMCALLAIYPPEANITGYVVDDACHIVALQLDGVTPRRRGWMPD